jgi:hypothetical protein
VEIEGLTAETPVYQAGLRNIGPSEIAKRRRYGIVAIGIAIVFGVAILTLALPVFTRTFVFFPLWVGVLSLLEAHLRFGARLAYSGTRSVQGTDATEAVDSAKDHAADREAARKLISRSALIAAAMTFAFTSLPIGR